MINGLVQYTTVEEFTRIQWVNILVSRFTYVKIPVTLKRSLAAGYVLIDFSLSPLEI